MTQHPAAEQGGPAAAPADGAVRGEHPGEGAGTEAGAPASGRRPGLPGLPGGARRAGARAVPEVVARPPGGAVRGVRRSTPHGEADSWRGVPYARPPVGEHRFAAAVPHEPWTGVRDATGPGPACAQRVPVVPAPLGLVLGTTGRRTEDCLTVDVHAPAGAAEDGRRRPVLVWVHGGAFSSGSAGEYDGSHLAARGDVVVVCVNYRLGMLGFADLADVVARPGPGRRGVDPERVPSNVGLRDQVLALEWVRDAVEAFGGDPARVTLAGESAGSASVALLMTSPAARGLFAGAVCQSGALSIATDREDATRLARELCAQLGVSREEPEGLWRASTREVLRAAAAVSATRPEGLTTRPWFDGDLLPASLPAAHATSTPPVPLLSGSNRDEHTLFRRFARDVLPETRARLAQALDAAAGPEETDRILSAYPRDERGLTDLGSHLLFTVPGIHHSEAHARTSPTWRYRVDWGPAAFGLGATHGVELYLLWPYAPVRRALQRLDRDGRVADLADRVQRHWLHFVRHGEPDPAVGPWPRYDAERRSTLVLDLEDRVVEDPEGEQRAVWGGRDVLVH
ncbi:carboxylesterase family protein [Pseudokineococcus marinus]|uniref:carboxylesterase/lipase family protein n=1 Tax=Pseudokineococcus marinus TaxID=351215 RepID=UPI00309AF8D4